jgi:Ca2+-binding RTX toxin-like protein
VTVSLGLQGSAQGTGAGTDTLTGFQNLLGSAFNDILIGDAAENTLSGGAGDDTLNPGANAGGTVDLLDGGVGSDTASFAGFTAGFTATLNGTTDAIASVGGLQIAALRSIENLLGGDGNDVLTGDANANAIDGGLGDDILDGGAGVDTLTFRGATGVTVNLATLTAQNTGVGNDTIIGFENVRTGAGADNVTGDANDNVLFDGGGADTYNGAGGTDTVDYSAATSNVTVNLNTVVAQNTGTFGGSDTITNVENVVGSAGFANTLTGNASANRLVGGAALDTIQGNSGADVIIGGAGNDVLLGGTSGALDDGSADTLEGGAGSDYLSGGQGNDILRGGDGDDSLIGGVGNTLRQYFTGVDGGDDTFDGGDGSDTAIMVYDGRIGVGASTVGVAFDLRSLAGNSDITFNGVSVGSLTSIETVVFRGTTVDDSVGGTGAADNLSGGAGNDVLDGWFGNDLLDGGLGNDTLTGGEGLDTATYASSTAGVNVDLRISGVAQDTGGQGVDTLNGIEYLTGSTFGDTLRGNDEFNLIIDSGVGAGATALSQTDSLFGYGGNDSIHVTRTAASVATNINMDGGDGDDFIELRGGTLSTALATNAAGLVGTTYLGLGATSNDRNSDVVTVDGGAGNDRIVLTGAASATVNAGSGADIVSISMRGISSVNNYLLTLGVGADIIQFGVGANAAASTDVAATSRTSRVTDFQVGNAGDKFEMTNFLNFGLTGYTANSNAFTSGHLRLVQSGTDLLLQSDRDGAGATNGFVTVFTISNGYTGGFTAYNFDGFIGNLTLTGFAGNDTITGATGNDVLSGGDGNDTLIGLGGNDTLDGGNGDDLLFGGTGDDTLIGGAGTDTASYSDATVGVTVNLSLAGAQATGWGSDTLSGIENLVGSAFNDTLTGDSAANRIEAGLGDDIVAGAAGNDVLFGGDGNDMLDGGDGDDALWGGSGDDIIAGGAGIDTAIYSDATTGVTVDLNLADAQATGRGTDTLSGIENLVGSAFNDLLTGDAGANRIEAGAGNDTVVGGAGDDVLVGGDGTDTLNYAGLTNSVQVNLASGQVNAGAQGGLDQVSGFEHAILGSADDLFIGDAANNHVEGGAGDDQLFGADGSDQLFGGLGTDQLFGGAGNDLLDGGLGADFMNGGAGDDHYVVDDAGDQITEFGGSGVDTVSSSISFVLSSGFENLTLTGTASIDATGNDANNYIVGNSGRNTLVGGAGDDTIVTVTGPAAIRPDGGFDRVDGGSGTDWLGLGGVQSDYQLLNIGGHSFLVTTRGATDVAGIEQVAFTGTAALSWSTLVASTAVFDGLSYIAGNADLRAAFGTDAGAGAQHFLEYGFAEGRALTFNALDYIASHSDLRVAFGADATAGAQHYIEYGATEGRAVTFDGWAYLASHDDLILAFGANEGAAAQHFITYGATEGRTITFDAAAYAAANSDLAALFGTDAEALARHYVMYGHEEGRPLVASASVAMASIAAAAAPDAAPVAAAFADSAAGHGIGGAFSSNALVDTTQFAENGNEVVSGGSGDYLASLISGSGLADFIVNTGAEASTSTAGYNDAGLVNGDAWVSATQSAHADYDVSGGGSVHDLMGHLNSHNFADFIIVDVAPGVSTDLFV